MTNHELINLAPAHVLCISNPRLRDVAQISGVCLPLYITDENGFATRFKQLVNKMKRRRTHEFTAN
ncbi:MAG: hypothetical protein FWC16_11225 [Defluviitaleaceae bacterium]|nr:hypothetical protein [Defluviitaleaceae bacterium]MCL2275489.1 hypothetical protein [Defluviitaleaceae bacterium]